MNHGRKPSEVPLFDGEESGRASVVPAARPVSPERSASRQRSARIVQERPCHCEDLPAPPARRGSRGSLGISLPPKMAGSNSNREQLLPPSGGGKGVPVKVDGHQATATLSSSGLSWNYEVTRCCLPGVRSGSVPFSEMLSAEVLSPVTGMWRLPGTRLQRMVVWTFRRSTQNPAAWFPCQLVLETAAEGVLREWLQRINAAIAQQPRRPRRLLVFCNPFGGSRRARQIWESVVRPVFDKAGIKSSAVETQHGGHARALLTNMPADELAGYDGVVAIGGDGFV